MESPGDFYRQLERLRLRIGDLGYNLLKLIEAYHRAGAPFTELPEDTPEPWTVIRRDVGERRVFLAQRYDWQAPVGAGSADALAAAIRDR